ncbi:hypothetical protein BC830DRAFT_802316 [Chytriomyces sp. MP71]|nr:hypothetical protein BC830DRAFT_802316 [Chytriomyces sp. MP71]
MKNSIVVIGREGVDTKGLVERITGQAASETETDVGNASITHHVLETKYYSARVSFWTASTTVATVAEWSDAVGDGVGALLLCVDSLLTTEGLEEKALAPWAAFVETNEVAVALLVDLNESGASASGRADEEEEHVKQDGFLDTAADWCARNGFELVALSDPPQLEGEAVGVARIVEALEANMWDGLVLTNNTSTTSTSASIVPRRLDIISVNESDGAFAHTDEGIQVQCKDSLLFPDPRRAALDFGEDADEYLDLKSMPKEEFLDDSTTRDEDAFLLQAKSIDELMASLALENDSFGDFMGASSSIQSDSSMSKLAMIGSMTDFDLPDFDEFDLSEHASQDMKKLRASLFGDLDDDDFFEKAVGQIKSLRENGSSLGNDKRKEMAKKLALALLCE